MGLEKVKHIVLVRPTPRHMIMIIQVTGNTGGASIN